MTATSMIVCSVRLKYVQMSLNHSHVALVDSQDDKKTLNKGRGMNCNRKDRRIRSKELIVNREAATGKMIRSLAK